MAEGARRSRASASPVAARRRSTPLAADVRVEQVARTSIRVRGWSTGRIYLFTPANPVQAVDASDAPSMIRSGAFRAAAG
jgi:hypothetical protein